VIGWLPQDPHLPGNTVRDIVNLGDSSISDDNVREALAKVRLDFLLDRETGEGARSLSAGQRRRLALARCLVRRPLLLLLDEPTAHLDGPNALVIEQILRELSMTRIVATHRPFIADVAIELRSLEKNAL
jgi:ABC-type transport system involved in cytochrome bd biosynthesis fused ATPase/permease subunit